MTDRLLLESGASDGYLLEDSSGVTLLDAQIGLRGGAYTIGSGTQGSSPRHLIPHLQNGDIVLALMHKDQASGGGSFSASSGTSGWTKAKENLWSSGGRNHGAALFYKVITDVSTEPTWWQFESSQSDDWTLAAVAFSNVDTASPIDAVVTENAGQDDPNPDAPDITTATDNALVVTMQGCTQGAPSIVYGPPSGFTSAVNAQAVDNSSAQIAYRLEASAGAKTPGVWTNTDGNPSSEYIAWTLALKAATVATSATGAIAGQPPTVAAAGTMSMVGTGAVSIPAATVAGTGIAGAVGTGAITGQPPTTAGTGSERMTATGAITGQPPTAVGSGTETLTATGAIAAQAPTINASGTETMTGTGAIAGTPPAIAGTGSTAEGTSGTGAITGAAPGISSSGTLSIPGTSGVIGKAPTAEGAGTLTIQGSGAMVGSPPGVAAVATLTIQGVGAILASSVAATGTGIGGAVGTGSLTGVAPSVLGVGDERFVASGVLLLPAALAAGAGGHGYPLPPGLAASVVSRGRGSRITDLAATGDAQRLGPGADVDQLVPTATARDMRSRT